MRWEYSLRGKAVRWVSEEECQGGGVRRHGDPERHADELALHDDRLGDGVPRHRPEDLEIPQVLILLWNVGEEEVQEHQDGVLHREGEVEYEAPADGLRYGAADEARGEDAGEVPGEDDGVECGFARWVGVVSGERDYDLGGDRAHAHEKRDYAEYYEGVGECEADCERS